MNIKHILLLSFIAFTSSILAQTEDDDFPDFTSNNRRYTEPQEKLIEIDISKLKKGYWLAENQTDSIYLNILDTKCYYYDKDTKPFTAKMTVKLTHVTAEKPQKVISDNYSEIHFEYLDTLPEPRYSSKHFSNYGEKNPKIYIFKKLLPNKLILQEKGNLNNTLIFNKINTEYPLFRQVQIEKLKEIKSKVIGLWKSKIEEKYYLIGGYPTISSDNWLENPPEILTTSIKLLQLEQDSVKAEKMYSYIQWSDNLEYTMQFSSSQKDKYKIEKLDSNSISLVIDSLNIKEDYFKMPFDQFPDSILRGIKNKVWCDTIFDSYTQKIDTLMFDFGDNLDTCKYEDIFFSCSGHLYDRGFHNMAHFDFFTFKNHCFYIKLTHGSIRLWEIVNLSSQYLTLRTTDEDDKIEIRQLFLHPQNKEYFDSQGRRMKY
jgi:hypothetical protein